MSGKEQRNPKLPLPKWCFVLLAAPTFYMPLSYLTVVTLAIRGMLTGRLGNPPGWLVNAMYPAIYVTFAMWPIYVAWVAISRRLSLREKGLWLLVVSLGNMVGMPAFYVFMLRRYLGIEGRAGPRDEAALDRFLARCGIGRDELSSDQRSVLRSYCRQHRLSKWGVFPMVALAAIMLYCAFVFLP